MFNLQVEPTPEPVIEKPPNTSILYPYNTPASLTEVNYNEIDSLLEKEKQNNKLDSWNKIDKTEKLQKLHAYAETYGKLHALPAKEVKHLKQFFIECLDKNKLQKTKDIVYNKESREITSIPSLFFNATSHNFTLKITDPKRVSTMKSLTPKRSEPETKE